MATTCHYKLVLLGDTAVGKSCLVVRFVRDEFFEFQEPTIGGSCSDARKAPTRHVTTRPRLASRAQPPSLPRQ